MYILWGSTRTRCLVCFQLASLSARYSVVHHHLYRSVATMRPKLTPMLVCSWVWGMPYRRTFMSASIYPFSATPIMTKKSLSQFRGLDDSSTVTVGCLAPSTHLALPPSPDANTKVRRGVKPDPTTWKQASTASMEPTRVLLPFDAPRPQTYLQS